MTVEITHNEAASRYEAHVDGALAGFIDYELDGERIVLPHTEVLPEFGGRGIGSALARGTLDAIRAAGTHKVVPQCPFVKAWLDRNPDYLSLVDDAAPTPDAD